MPSSKALDGQRLCWLRYVPACSCSGGLSFHVDKATVAVIFRTCRAKSLISTFAQHGGRSIWTFIKINGICFIKNFDVGKRRGYLRTQTTLHIHFAVQNHFYIFHSIGQVHIVDFILAKFITSKSTTCSFTTGCSSPTSMTTTSLSITSLWWCTIGSLTSLWRTTRLTSLNLRQGWQRMLRVCG